VDAKFIRQELKTLKTADASRRLFGASVHQYKLHRRLDEQTVARFEREHGIALPEDYRSFLTEIGNGGAGPSYGVFKLGEMDGLGSKSEVWHAGVFVGQLRDPFPHEQAWNLPPERFAEMHRLSGAAYDDYAQRLDQEYWDLRHVAGAIPICHHGCALRDWLVVSGPRAGTVWHDARTSDGGLSPVTDEQGRMLSFSGWYLAWLRSARREITLG
jgi:hypothetical protein